MKENRPFSVRARLKSFAYAFRGLIEFFRREHNAWIHLLATIIVIEFGFLLHISQGEWVALTLVMGFVWVAELFNTAIERILDFIGPDQDQRVRIIKDISAGAVLVAAIVAVIIGCIIFIPKY